MKTTFLIAAIAAGITLAATVDAREGRLARADMPTFEQLDANADGSITLAEVEAARTAGAGERFAATDTNGDGALSADELIAAAGEAREGRMAERVATRIERADTNGDGVLQADEIQSRGEGRGPNVERMFDRVDANDDGAISEEEYAQLDGGVHQRGERGPRHDN